MRARHVDPLAAVYAEALGQVGDARGGEELLREISEALSGLGQAWGRDRHLRAYFLSAMVKQEEKERALLKLLAPLPPLLADFVQVLIRRGRGRILDKVAIAYEAWLDQRLGRVPVTLTTALPVPHEQVQAWTERLRTAMGKEPLLDHVVRPELLSGATIRVGDLVLDGSGQHKLAELRSHVRERGKHAVQA